MNILRAQVVTKDGWWEARLLDLDIVADGASESEMLRDLEHTLIAEYRIAMHKGETPFVRLLKGCPTEVSKSWEDGGKRCRMLDLPEQVRAALAAVFRQPRIGQFNLEEPYASAA